MVRAPLACLLTLTAGVACQEPAPERVFERDVAPLLEGRCLSEACHGVGPASAERGEVVNWDFFHVRVREDGRIRDLESAYERTKSRINTIERGELSTLLRKPLSVASGGVVHAGGAQFDRQDDSAFATLLDWIESETGGGEGEPSESLSANERWFADFVEPQLLALQCMNAACHGPFAPFTSFEPPMPIAGDYFFSTEATRKNYKSARVHLSLGGELALSRLVRKGLPLDRGGIVHRGGNDIFFSRGSMDDPLADPAVDAIIEWAEAEREDAVGAGVPELRGIVMVRGPVGPQRPFDHDVFNPGTDLYVLEPPSPGGALRALTAAAHPAGPADVRDPAVSHDAERVAFSMRTSETEAFNLFEIGIDGTGLRQLTFDEPTAPGGGLVANVQPTYGPDGRIYFVSTRSGHLADGYSQLDGEIWAVDPGAGDLERITFDPSPQATPSFIGTGKTYGTLAFTTLRAMGHRYEAPVLRMPLDHNKAFHADPEIHIHHGVSIPEEIVLGMRTMHDGRFVSTLLDRTNQWRGGRLAVFDRQLGPEMPAGAEPDAAVGGFRHAFSVLDEGVSASGESPGGVYRRPVPLPDGRLLVSHAPGPIDLDDPLENVVLALQALTLREDRSSGRPQIAAREALVLEPGVSVYDAEPIVARPLEDDPTHEPAWDETRTEPAGLLAYRHVETLEAIFTNLEQRGEKTIRDDLAFARIVESVRVSEQDLESGPIGVSAWGRSRILAEVPLAGGSLYAEVPADVPFRLQFLNADRMVVGAQHNRWLHVAPAEVFPGGISPELYPTLCAGCHGSLSGAPGDVGGPVPDAVTTASMTLATHENLDPRRPLRPVSVGQSVQDVDFRRDVLPLLERSCAVDGCHRGGKAAGGLDLVPAPTAEFDTAYEALLAPGTGSGVRWRYVDAAGASAYTSYLIERIYGRELGASRTLDGACPGDPPLDDGERLTIVRWVDLGAVYRGAVP